MIWSSHSCINRVRNRLFGFRLFSWGSSYYLVFVFDEFFLVQLLVFWLLPWGSLTGLGHDRIKAMAMLTGSIRFISSCRGHQVTPQTFDKSDS